MRPGAEQARRGTVHAADGGRCATGYRRYGIPKTSEGDVFARRYLVDQRPVTPYNPLPGYQGAYSHRRLPVLYHHVICTSTLEIFEFFVFRNPSNGNVFGCSNLETSPQFFSLRDRIRKFMMRTIQNQKVMADVNGSIGNKEAEGNANA